MRNVQGDTRYYSVLGNIPLHHELITGLEQMRQHNNGLKNEALLIELDQVNERQLIFEAFMEDVREGRIRNNN